MNKTTKRSTNDFPFYSPEELERMSNEEQQMLDIKIYSYGIDVGAIYLPYKNNKGNYMETNSSGQYAGIRIYNPNEVSLEDIQKQLYPELTSYISVNVLKESAKSNQKSEYKYIAEMYIDIDVCHDCPEQLLMELPKVQKKIEEAMQEKTIPMPTKYMMTGRGFALHYKYSNLLTMECAEAKVHEAIYKLVMKKIEGVIIGNNVEVDSVVFNVNRVARIAGTKNPKSGTYCRILAMGPRYTVFELRNAFGISPEESLREMSDLPKRTKKTSLASQRRSSIAYKPISNDLPRTTKPRKDYAGFLLKCLDTYYERTTWIEGKHRERFLFIYYNCYKLLYGAIEAYKKINQLNFYMQEPLAIRELSNLMRNSDNHIEITDIHGDGLYLYGKDRVIEVLEIDFEEADACGFYKNEHKAAVNLEKQRAHCQLKEEQEKAVLELYLVNGFGYKMIQKLITEELPSELRCSLSTIKRIVNKSGFCEEDKGNAELFEKYYGRGSTFLHNYGGGGGSYINKEQSVEENSNVSYSLSSPPSTNDNLLAARILYEKYLENEKNESPVIWNEILEAFHRQENVYLAGCGGTGKTYHTVQDFYYKLPKEEQKRIQFLAMCGRVAASLPNGKTLHSFFKMDSRVYLPEESCDGFEALFDYEKIIIDEISQVRVDIFTHIMNLVHYAEEVYHKRIQVILLGDFSQTKPVLVEKEEALFSKYYGDKLYAFESVEWQNSNFRQFTLYDSKRQEEEAFKRNLTALRFGMKESLDFFNTVLDRTFCENAITICPTNRLVEKYNREKIMQFTDRQVFRGVRSGIYDGTNSPLAQKPLEFAVGMQVMSTVNQKSYKNGMLGIITKITDEGIFVRFKDKKRSVCVKKYTHKQGNGSFTQYPLTYGYAITSDKSQGMTLDEVNIVPGFFSEGQLYTALSRCKTLAGIHLLGDLNEKELVVDVKALEYCI